jgi:hypothetical protein
MVEPKLPIHAVLDDRRDRLGAGRSEVQILSPRSAFSLVTGRFGSAMGQPMGQSATRGSTGVGMTPDEYRVHRERLEEFRALYVDWRDGYAARRDYEHVAMTQRVNALEPAASRALAAAGRPATGRVGAAGSSESLISSSAVSVRLCSKPVRPAWWPELRTLSQRIS